MSKNKAKLLCIDALIAMILLAFDQFTKYLAVARLRGKDAFILIKDVLEFDYVENRGAAFGVLQNQKILLVAVCILFLLALCFLLYRIPDHKKYLPVHIVSAMIIAGGLGNMIDRIRLDYVIDFISFILIDYPVFNVADIYVVVSVIIAFILLLFVYKDDDLNFLGRKRK